MACSTCTAVSDHFSGDFWSPLTCVQALSVCADGCGSMALPSGCWGSGWYPVGAAGGVQGLRAGHSCPGAGSAECDARKAGFENKISPKTSDEKMEMSLSLPRISLPQVWYLVFGSVPPFLCHEAGRQSRARQLLGTGGRPEDTVQSAQRVLTSLW